MRKKIVNLSSLVVIQGTNAIFPLVVFPYAFSIVGSDLYSRIVLSEAMSLFLLAVVLYSFEIDGVASVVGMNPITDADKISGILSGVVWTRLFLFAFGAPIALLVAWGVDPQILPAICCWLLVPLSYAIQPNWLYQGLEVNAPVALITSATRVAALTVVLLFLSDKVNYLLVPLAIGGFNLLGACLSLVYSLYRFNLRFVRPEAADLRRNLFYGREIFAANFCVGLYREANILILSVLNIPGDAISVYSLAEKFVKVLQAAIRPLNQFYFPRAIGVVKKASRPDAIVFYSLARITWRQLAVLFLALTVGALLFLFMKESIPWFDKLENRDRISALVSMMCIASFFGVGNFVFGMTGLSNLGERRALLFAMAGTGLANIAVCTLLSSFFSEIGAAISFSLSEIVLFFLIVRKYFSGKTVAGHAV